MKRAVLAALLLFLMTVPFALATPYNTITVDGLWGVGEWDQANETVASNTFAGWNEFGNVRDILVTWDASYLYVGVKGNSWNNAMLIYIDSSSISTGQENADYFQGYDTQSFFDPDFVCGHYNMPHGSGGTIPTDVRSISSVDGSTASLLGTAMIAVMDQNSDGGLGQGFTEIAIPWSLIGLEQGGSVKVACGVGWAVNQDPVIPAGGLGGFSGDELGGTDQQGGTDALDGTLDTPVMVVYDNDDDSLPDEMSDNLPPTLIGACSDQADSDLYATFDEPVTSASSQNLANWSISGGLSIVSAVQTGPATVLLLLDGTLPYGETITVTADNIVDLNSNVSGPTSRNFCLAQLTIIAHMEIKIEANGGPILDVGIEGSLAPLTWDPACDLLMHDDGSNGDAMAGDSIYAVQLDFCLPYGPGEDPPVEPLVYKLTYGCTEWESIDNHYYNQPGLSCDTGQDMVEVWWDDINPDNLTTSPVDVVFSVDLSDSLDAFAAGDRLLIGMNGGTGGGTPIPPLNWNVPSETALSDDGYPGGVAGDNIYGASITFPAGSIKDVQYKFLYNDEYECSDQGNRNVFLNEDLSPLILPTGRLQRCTVSKQAIDVLFRLDMSNWHEAPGAEDIIAVNGTPNNQEPQSINWDIPSINPMVDDGSIPEDTAGDLIYTGIVSFPDSSSFQVEYKYLFNEAYECTSQTNRVFWLDDTITAAAVVQDLGVDVWFLCEEVGVEDGLVVSAARLDGNWPNPFNPKTTLRFVLDEAAPVRLQVYDLSGRLVRTLINAQAPAGENVVVWNGTDDLGQSVSSGIYFARLTALGRVDISKMTLLK